MDERPMQLGFLADALLTACVVLGSVATVSAHSDSWVTVKARITLLTDRTVNASAVDVDADDGLVTLHGEVGSEAEKSAVESLVRRVHGVRDVESLLSVVPHEVPKRMRSDYELAAAVESALASERTLAESNIRVVAVNDGIVTIEGNAATMTAHAQALQVAFRVPGVLGLRASIDAPDVLSEAEMVAHRSATKPPASAEAQSHPH